MVSFVSGQGAAAMCIYKWAIHALRGHTRTAAMPSVPRWSLVAHHGAKRQKEKGGEKRDTQLRPVLLLLHLVPHRCGLQCVLFLCSYVGCNTFLIFFCVCVTMFFRNKSCFTVVHTQVVKCRHSHEHMLCDILLSMRLVFPAIPKCGHCCSCFLISFRCRPGVLRSWFAECIWKAR